MEDTVFLLGIEFSKKKRIVDEHKEIADLKQ